MYFLNKTKADACQREARMLHEMTIKLLEQQSRYNSRVQALAEAFADNLAVYRVAVSDFTAVITSYADDCDQVVAAAPDSWHNTSDARYTQEKVSEWRSFAAHAGELSRKADFVAPDKIYIDFVNFTMLPSAD